MEEVVFVRDHYAWKRENFTFWNRILPIGGVLMPYQGGTAPYLVGDGQNFWEVHPQKNDAVVFSSKFGFIVRHQDFYQIQSGMLQIGQTPNISEAVEILHHCCAEVPPLEPMYLYREPDGRLLSILEDPQSVLIFLCGWKDFRRQGNEFKELNAEQKDQFAGFLSLPYWTLKKYHQDQQQRADNAKFPFEEDIIEVRSEHFASNSLHFDSVAHVLKSEYTGNPATVEFFKAQMLELAEKYDLDAIYVKEGRDTYALGCRHEEFLAEYRGQQVRQLANYLQRDALCGSPLQALFEYLDRIKNNQYTVMSHRHTFKETKWIEEGLPRPEFTLGSMMRAVAYYSEQSTLYRRQWRKILNPTRNLGKRA